VTSLEGQLAEVQETLEEETRQKLAAQGKVRQAEDELASLREQIEEEEDSKKALETKITALSAQVGFVGHTVFSRNKDIFHVGCNPCSLIVVVVVVVSTFVKRTISKISH